jgi:DNA-binding transcriptional LysR family regulator
MFGWDDLRYFLELSRRGRLLAAAERLGVDHTTVGRRIAALETSLNTQLFDRTPRGYSLTAAGQRLLVHAEQMESTSLAIHGDLTGGDQILTGAVRVGTAEGFGSRFLAPRLPLLHQRHPGIELDLVTSARFISLSKREADIAINLTRPTTGRLVARKLCDYALRLYATADYLARAPRLHSRDDLPNHVLVGYVDDLIFAQELRYLDETLPNLHPSFRASSVLTQFEAVLAGTGIGVLHCFMADGQPGLVQVLPELTIWREYWLVTHEDLRSIARIQAVSRFIIEQVEAHQPLLRGEPMAATSPQPAPPAPAR